MHYFITDNKANVVGIVMAGSADFKTELQMSDLFDPRLLVSSVAGVVVRAVCFYALIDGIRGRRVVVITNLSSQRHERLRLTPPYLHPPPPLFPVFGERRRW